MSLCAVGDNLIHDSVYKKFRSKDGGWDFSPIYSHVRELIESHDISVINQETIFVDDTKKVSTYPCFGTPVEMGDALVGAGFNVVLTATNHAWDKQGYGVDTTLRYWKAKHPEIVVLGTHDSPEDRSRIEIMQINGMRIAMFNYTYGLNGFVLPAKEWFKVDLLADKERFLNDVRRAETMADFTVCFLHIGEEYRYTPSAFQKQYARELADAGADLIICAHPHVVEPFEMLAAADGHPCLVYYSCGNFVSGQGRVDRLLGGMAQVRIARQKSEDGSYVARIVWHDFVPTVTHRTAKTVEAYFLSDYSESLARQHSVKGVSLAKLNGLWKKITGTEVHAPVSCRRQQTERF
ncbi:MAG: CapA family protein [Mailhella sp.]|nr:CapA family protein [Mailhella sp.]